MTDRVIRWIGVVFRGFVQALSLLSSFPWTRRRVFKGCVLVAGGLLLTLSITALIPVHTLISGNLPPMPSPFVSRAYAQSPQAENSASGASQADGNQINPDQLPDSSFIYDTSILALSGADSYYDNQTVQVIGEAIGDNIRANFSGTNRWITLMALDGSYAEISVLMSEEFARRIDTFGAYEKHGSTLQVQGTFHLVCPQHDGVSDLHADYVTVLSKGYTTHSSFNVSNFFVGGIVVALGLLCIVVFYRMRQRLR